MEDMTTIDVHGNRHRGAGIDGGQFTEHARSAPELDDELDAPEPEPGLHPYVYSIPTQNIGALRLRVGKANERLAKAGVAERFTYTITPRIVTHPRSGETYETNDVQLNTPRISAGDWKFDGVHEQAANGKVISHYTHGAEPVLGASGDGRDLLLCEHCGHRRARSKVFVVSSPTKGETKQVGSNCLELFLGVKPAGLWALTADAMLEDLRVDDDDLESWGGLPDGTSISRADDVLALTVRVVAEDGGYLSKEKAGFHEMPTAEKVLGRLAEHGARHADLTDVEKEEIAEVFAWIDAEAAVADHDRSSYMDNLVKVLATDEDGLRLVSRKHVPIVASAVSSYRNHKARELRRALEEEAKRTRDALKKQEFLAPVGTKLKGAGVEATILSVHLGHDYGYGAPLHVSMMDDDGHVLYWKCTGFLGGSYTTPGGKQINWQPDHGTRVSIASGTVKDNHVSEYNGDWETVLTRAKLVPPASSLEAWDSMTWDEIGEDIGGY